MYRLMIWIALLFPIGAAVCAHNVSAATQSDLGLLTRLAVIRGAAYWEEHAVPGQTCDGNKVRDLLDNMARTIDPKDGARHPLDVLMARKVIWNDYWSKNALPGKQCNGEYVATLIHVGAEHLGDLDLVRRFPMREGLIPQPTPSAFSLGSEKGDPRAFNTILGTQTFSPAYHFTQKPLLLETAEAIRALGCNVIKFGLSARYAGPNRNVSSPIAGIHSLTELARDEPTHRKVLDMPFSHFVLWAHTFSVGESRWRNGFSKADEAAEYREMFDLTRYLLRQYTGTGKTFYLGHWEGDGLLRGSTAPENDARVTRTAVDGMVAWLNTRQSAVDDAKRETPHSGVQVWNYTEVNHVKLAMQGRPALVNEVLPRTNVDLVSYSSYDTMANPQLLKRALSFIESKLPAKPGFVGRRVFIGEYGFPAIRFTPQEQDRMSRQLVRAGIEWGCPLILYWEIYNNEVETDGKQRGFWLIDDKGVRQPVYETHRRCLDSIDKYVTAQRARSGKMPTNDAVRRAAIDALTGKP